MNNEWENAGICSEEELSEKVRGFDYKYYLAYQTDKFLAGLKSTGSLDRIEWDKLLEIRLFSETHELLARRTMTGKDNMFQWRIASEENMKDDEYIIRYQTLDIDSNFTFQGENGNLKLMTTGGGEYELPINKDMTKVKIISYVLYSNEDGMASVYDNRLAGFMKEGED